LNRREFVLVLALVVFIVLIGIFPNYVLNPMQASITELLNQTTMAGLIK
jgi:NADH:ubiquinone oxidoreductase subunit 4 (subunit M)